MCQDNPNNTGSNSLPIVSPSNMTFILLRQKNLTYTQEKKKHTNLFHLQYAFIIKYVRINIEISDTNIPEKAYKQFRQFQQSNSLTKYPKPSKTKPLNLRTHQILVGITFRLDNQSSQNKQGNNFTKKILQSGINTNVTFFKVMFSLLCSTFNMLAISSTERTSFSYFIEWKFYMQNVECN